MIKVKKVFFNVHLGYGHDGLSEWAYATEKVRVDKMDKHDVLVFINRAQDKVKVIGQQGTVLGYYRAPPKCRIVLEAIQFIPAAFGGAGFNFDQAQKLALIERLKKKHGASLANAESKKSQ